MSMTADEGLKNNIFNHSGSAFTKTTLKVFRFQYEHNKIYRAYCEILKADPDSIKHIEAIPFLPIQFFKTQDIRSGNFEAEIYFESSGTTGSVNSKHFVKDKSLYEESFLRTFRQFYGNEQQLCIIGLLPSYLERSHSSLVYMVQDLINRSGNARSGFYLHDHEKLKEALSANEAAGQPTLLIGVTYALLDFAEANRMDLQHTIIMETGGMKGRREELTRKEIHEILSANLGVRKIHSEYGMTELLSQAYSSGDGIFSCPPWMKILLRSEDDPLEVFSDTGADKNYRTGAVNIIDLANLYSCSFLATDDAGKIYKDGHFEITGRLDNSDLRGCSLMYV